MRYARQHLLPPPTFELGPASDLLGDHDAYVFWPVHHAHSATQRCPEPVSGQQRRGSRPRHPGGCLNRHTTEERGAAGAVRSLLNQRVAPDQVAISINGGEDRTHEAVGAVLSSHGYRRHSLPTVPGLPAALESWWLDPGARHHGGAVCRQDRQVGQHQCPGHQRRGARRSDSGLWTATPFWTRVLSGRCATTSTACGAGPAAWCWRTTPCNLGR